KRKKKRKKNSFGPAASLILKHPPCPLKSNSCIVDLSTPQCPCYQQSHQFVSVVIDLDWHLRNVNGQILNIQVPKSNTIEFIEIFTVKTRLVRCKSSDPPRKRTLPTGAISFQYEHIAPELLAF